MITPSDIQAVFARATCLHAKPAVEAALDRMASAIKEKLTGTDPVVLCTMIGGIIPAGHLLPRLDFPLQVDYIHATRYRNTAPTSCEATAGYELEWRNEPHISIASRTVLIIDDILDGGITLAGIIDYCKKHEAKEIYTAVLVDKETTRLPGGVVKADFTGMRVENRYVFGFGMDYKRYLRNAPGIYAVDPQDAQ